MCDGCLDLVDRLVEPITASMKGNRREMYRLCDHTPFCGFRALRPAERERWMREALPVTHTMLVLKNS